MMAKVKNGKFVGRMYVGIKKMFTFALELVLSSSDSAGQEEYWAQTRWSGARMLSGEPAKAQEIFRWGIRCVKIRSKSAYRWVCT